jgi:hypothetical protein
MRRIARGLSNLIFSACLAFVIALAISNVAAYAGEGGPNKPPLSCGPAVQDTQTDDWDCYEPEIARRMVTNPAPSPQLR